MALIISGLFMLAFVANVVLGAFTPQAPVGDVGEMLLLLGASVAFVAAILMREAAENKDD
ncbi:hypothetical protein ACVDG3_11540 [Meridianimarinicoccus sp. RP-17]|uniref:hypothetical protein n=1 Tax=Meridianimarinicoccus zhengii TaxID=2056810 RepID=UPI000DAE4904|nr:hypothetical protein [Phycocomes zhengii]